MIHASRAIGLALTAALAAAQAQTLLLTGAKIYTSPRAAPIQDGAVLITGARITAVGPRASVKAPAGAEVLDCKGLVIAAGFQNSHVHFTESKWDDAANQPAPKLQRQLQEMLTSWGFTTVVDTASSLLNTVAMRKRINAGQIAGPRILTAGGAIYPPGRLPFYLYKVLSPEVLKTLPQPATPEAARAEARRNIEYGADVTKLFVGALATPREVNVMPLDIATAAAEESHRKGKLVLAHPSSVEAIRVCLRAGVDILVHTTPDGGDWDAALLAEMRRQKMSVIPTLKLWVYEMRKAGVPQAAASFTRGGIAQLAAFSKAGGRVLFGTDVGYMTEYDPAQEYELMRDAGMDAMAILTSLTTAPAARFDGGKRGMIARGFDADLVVMEGDPADDIRNFARVRYTVRGGRIIYRAPLTRPPTAP